ncbi:hypothetical protein HDU86_007177 [Geranomyces michiganensis]|nr:hypothetical protein HDU86_007177 [Geranomyces michiganensis]
MSSPMSSPWTAEEKARLAHILRRHPNSWSIDSLLSDFPQKSYLQLAAFLSALRKKAPELFIREPVINGEDHRECDACRAEALSVLPPASDADVAIIRYPSLLRVSHDSYMGETSRPKLEADSARFLAASLRAWLARVVPVAAAMAVERHKIVASLLPTTSPVVKVDENMVLAALQVVDPGCCPPHLMLRLANHRKSEEISNATERNNDGDSSDGTNIVSDEESS